MTKRTVIETDNRDQYTTTLILDNGDTVDVNPVELVMNMIENLPEDGDHSVIDELRDFLKDLT